MAVLFLEANADKLVEAYRKAEAASAGAAKGAADLAAEYDRVKREADAAIRPLNAVADAQKRATREATAATQASIGVERQATAATLAATATNAASISVEREATAATLNATDATAASIDIEKAATAATVTSTAVTGQSIAVTAASTTATLAAATATGASTAATVLGIAATRAWSFAVTTATRVWKGFTRAIFIGPLIALTAELARMALAAIGFGESAEDAGEKAVTMTERVVRLTEATNAYNDAVIFGIPRAATSALQSQITALEEIQDQLSQGESVTRAALTAAGVDTHGILADNAGRGGIGSGPSALLAGSRGASAADQTVSGREASDRITQRIAELRGELDKTTGAVDKATSAVEVQAGWVQRLSEAYGAIRSSGPVEGPGVSAGAAQVGADTEARQAALESFISASEQQVLAAQMGAEAFEAQAQRAELLVLLQGEGITTTERVIAAENARLDVIRQVTEAQRELAKAAAESAGRVASYSGAFSSAAVSFLTGVETATDAVRNFATRVASVLLESAVSGTADTVGKGLEAYFSSGAATSAKGNAFAPAGIIPFALGGVVTQPSLFSYGGGKTGSIAENAPEAVMPLARDSQGRLGVRGGGGGNVTVNVYGVSDTDGFRRNEKQIANRAINTLRGR